MDRRRYSSGTFWMVFMGCLLFFSGCNDQLSGPLFKSQYPHQRYSAQLERTELAKSLLYREWRQAAQQSLVEPVPIMVPYHESAFMAGSSPRAVAYVFDAREGERLQVTFALQSMDSLQLFVDLFAFPADSTSDAKHLVSADTGTSGLSWDVRRDGRYILRVQPELLAEVSYDLWVTADPSLANPVDPQARQHVGSVFGDPRDGGARRHEGIDIFAPRLTPVVAAAEGTVTRVGDNRLGGKVVWLRPQGRGINLYYAHLDSQMVKPGQLVRTGDTLGLMGTTGNARTTPPHLHFGVYGQNGAVDPLPFVRPDKSDAPPINTDKSLIGDTLRVTARSSTIAAINTPVTLEAATASGYRVLLPDGTNHVLSAREIGPLNPLRTFRLEHLPTIVYSQPDSSSARVRIFEVEATVRAIAEYGEFVLIDAPERGWILR